MLFSATNKSIVHAGVRASGVCISRHESHLYVNAARSHAGNSRCAHPRATSCSDARFRKSCDRSGASDRDKFVSTPFISLLIGTLVKRWWTIFSRSRAIKGEKGAFDKMQRRWKRSCLGENCYTLFSFSRFLFDLLFNLFVMERSSELSFYKKSTFSSDGNTMMCEKFTNSGH